MDTHDDLKGKVIDAIKLFRKDEDKKNDDGKSKQVSVSQNAVGNNIIQTAGDFNGTINSEVNIHNSPAKKVIAPPKGSIGNNAILIETITGLFNKLGERREQRFGKSAYSVMYSTFKKDFGIPKNQKYTTYKLWKESRAEEIINYLNEKLDNTISGRKENSAKRKGHTRPYLLKKTKELHDALGWSEEYYRGILHYLFGVTSRATLNMSQLSSYIEYLQQEYDKKY